MTEKDFAEDELFMTKTGLQFPGFDSETLHGARSKLLSEIGLTALQITEAASYSLAMVVRYALGLSAEDGKVTALVNDSLSGWIALAALRHLRNAGGQCTIVSLCDPESAGIEFTTLLKPLKISGVDLILCSESAIPDSVEALIAGSHNLLCGTFELGSKPPGWYAKIVEMLNELPTPIHSVEAPLFVDVDSGAGEGSPLFSSSTLSLGAPLIGLNRGADFVGRHYLCDISIPPELYSEMGFNLSPLFSEQPVSQILPYAAQEDAEAS